jgi:Ca-activated chloride channel family protein
VSFFEANNLHLSSSIYKKIFFYLRFLILALLIFLIAKPQFGDKNSKINVDGIDIILALDVSGSMLCFDDMNDRRTRIEVAKEESIDFINKRENDPIGLVIFGRWALSRSPLTMDKKMLIDIIKDLKIGEIDHNETVISTALLNAINRLKNSKAKSKVIILITDGEPTQSDTSPALPIEIAKKLGIKIYTIGIGSEHGGLTSHPFFGVVPVGAKLNKELLIKIANETGGKFFYSKNPADMKNIYKTIDNLEKSEYETNIFHKYYDFFIPVIFVILCLVFIEQILATFVWFYL